MSYEIQFKGRDRAAIIIDNDKGAKLWDLWFAGDNKDMPVDAGNRQAFLIGDIRGINQVPDPKIEIPDFAQSTLPEGKKCQARYSIQREINNVIKSDYPADWAKKITDPAFRETIRKQLKSVAGTLWCDDKTGECAC